MPDVPYRYIKKSELDTKIRIPYTLDEAVNYVDDVTRKYTSFAKDVDNYKKSKNYQHNYPIQSLLRLLEAVKTSKSYLKNTSNQSKLSQEFYI